MCEYPKVFPQKIQKSAKIGVKSAPNSKSLVSSRFGYQVIQSVSRLLHDSSKNVTWKDDGFCV